MSKVKCKCDCIQDDDTIFVVDAVASFKTDAICIRCKKEFVFFPEDKITTINVSCPKDFFGFICWEWQYFMRENEGNIELSFAMLVRVSEMYSMYVDKFSVYKFSDVRDSIAQVIGAEEGLAYESSLIYFKKIREVLYEAQKTDLKTLSCIARHLSENGFQREKLTELFGPLSFPKFYVKYSSDDYEKVVRNHVFSYIIKVAAEASQLKNISGHILNFTELDKEDPMSSQYAQKVLFKELSKIQNSIIVLEEAILMSIK